MTCPITILQARLHILTLYWPEKRNSHSNLIRFCPERIQQQAESHSWPGRIHVSILFLGSCSLFIRGQKTKHYSSSTNCHSSTQTYSGILAQAALCGEVAFAMRSRPLLLPTFALSLFFSLCLLLLTHFGETPVCENLFPPIFWHN